MTKQVTFVPYGIKVQVEDGGNLLRAALDAGVHIDASCGGEGVCGKCKVIVESGEVDTAYPELLSAAERAKGFHQACQARVKSDVIVRIPTSSLLDGRSLARRRPKLSLRPAPIDLDELRRAGLYNPAFQKRFVKLPPPTPSNNICDLSRLEEGLARQHGLEKVTLDYHLMRKLGWAMREKNFQVTTTLDFSRRRYVYPHMLNVEPGDTTGRHFTFAVDIGTTTVWVQLVDIANGAIMGLEADYNGQISYGDDVITRIVFSQKEKGLEELQKAAASTINRLMRRLLERFKVSMEEISHVTIAANTTMTHLFYGIDPRYIRLSPYTPTARNVPLARARDLGLETPPHIFINCVSSVSSYVGGDIVAGILASGIYKDPKVSVYLDIGTNGEIAIGNREWLVCAACSAGPAFEGGGIEFGMRAMSGAIENVSINPNTCEPMLITIGMSKPKGICGSGMINLLAALLEAGLLEPNGKFSSSLETSRVRVGENGREFVVAWAPDTQIAQDITINEVDIDNFMRAKAAMFAGSATLLENVGLTFHEIEQVILAGSFGSSVNIENAITIGLLPDLPRDRFQFLGNGSLQGATFMALSRELLSEERRVASMMTNFDLSETPGFMDNYIAALFLPHTKTEYFPTIMERLFPHKDDSH
ncbi:MAG: ASKHA domain-containing protein [Syntrophobacteraceae bacterium]